MNLILIKLGILLLPALINYSYFLIVDFIMFTLSVTFGVTFDSYASDYNFFIGTVTPNIVTLAVSVYIAIVLWQKYITKHVQAESVC